MEHFGRSPERNLTGVAQMNGFENNMQQISILIFLSETGMGFQFKLYKLSQQWNGIFLMS